ncbi:UNVERIFIED_CONTAM: hypothetical protein RF648_20095 [Kocuria sp. CPCC 205274]
MFAQSHKLFLRVNMSHEETEKLREWFSVVMSGKSPTVESCDIVLDLLEGLNSHAEFLSQFEPHEVTPPRWDLMSRNDLLLEQDILFMCGNLKSKPQ